MPLSIVKTEPIDKPLAVVSQTPLAPGNPTGSIEAAKPETWLEQADHDVTQGGGRTVLGRILGTMQGRGDKGYSGLESGTSKGAANFMGSPILGSLHAAESAQSIPEHPVKGVLGTIGGALEAATIPSMMAGGGPGMVASKAIDLVPSADHASELFGGLNEALAQHPVELKAALKPLLRATEIGERGSTIPPAVSKLLTRSQAIEPMTFPEARDYQSSLSDLSMSDKLAMGGRMKGQVAQLGKGLYGDLLDSASSAGMGEDYANAMKEYRQAMQLRSGLKTAAKYGVGAGATAVGGSILAPHLKSLIGK